MFSTGIMIIPQGDIADIVAVAQAAENAGYDFCLIADEGFTYDVYVMMTTIAAHTTRIRLAPITNPYTRHPAVTAAALASVSTLAPGRIFLNVVAGGSLVLGPMNLSAEQPAVSCREMIQIVRALESGQKSDLTGKHFQLAGAQLHIPAKPIDIWVMARGPRMVQMAGECADVVVVQSKLGIRNTFAEARKGASKRGGALQPAYLGNLAFNQGVMDKMRPHYTYTIPDSPASVWDELGLSADWVAELKRTREVEGQQSAARLISDDLLRRCMIGGTSAECARDVRRLAEEYHFAHFILPVMSLDRNYALPLLETAARIYQQAKEI